jgi:small subunit ribosomal protein S9
MADEQHDEPSTPDAAPTGEAPTEPTASEDAPATEPAASEDAPATEPAASEDAPATEPAASEDAPATEPAASEDAPATEPAASEEAPVEQPAEPVASEETPPAAVTVSEDAPTGQAAEQSAPAAPERAAEEETPTAESAATEAPAAAQETPTAQSDEDDDEEESTPRVKPEVPGLHLEVDIVPEGADPFGRDEPVDPYATDPYATEEEQPERAAEEEQAPQAPQPISTAAIDLAAGARYKATGKRKTAIARVVLRPGAGTYSINGRELDQYVPRVALQRNIRQPLETVGYEERMDVVARVHGGGMSSQAGALRHGIARALIEADPNLRGELKRRGFLTRDARVKERKKAGLKKARKRPQFSKR